MDLQNLSRRMKEHAQKTPYNVAGTGVNTSREHAQSLEHEGKRYDLILTLNVMNNIPFWQLSISHEDSKPSQLVVAEIVTAFFGDTAVMDITSLLPAECRPDTCWQLAVTYKEEDCLFEHVFGKDVGLLQELAVDDALKINGTKSEAWITAMVRFIRNPLEFPQPVFPRMPGRYEPHKELNALGHLFHDLVGNRVCPVAMTNTVSSLSFWAEIKPEAKLAVVMCPPNFHNMVEQDVHMQMGGIIFSASKARDYWNNKITTNRDDIIKRAKAYESEYLHTLVGLEAAHFIPNDYQKSVMNSFPEGLKSLSASLHYESKPFDIKRAKTEFIDITGGRGR